MRSDGQRPSGGVPRPAGAGKNNGFFPSSLKAFSSYLRIVSSGASTVASTVRSAGVSVASSIASDRGDDGRDQVHWAGFDKLECEGGVLRQVLLLGYRSGFQVWDVEEADDVRQLVSRHEGPVSFLQTINKPMSSKRSEDKFAKHRPLIAVVGDGAFSGVSGLQDGASPPCNGNGVSCHDPGNENFLPTFVRFYSLWTHAHVHVLKFRSPVYLVRCSPRIVAISQAKQIHCLDAATLETEYTILTYPIPLGTPGSGGIGYGPLAVGTRWLAYSGSPVVFSNTSRVSPQHLNHATSFSASSNGSLVAHYAKESSKQLAAGIVTLGDMGYKKLSRYCSELLPDGNNAQRVLNHGFKSNGTINGHVADAENSGMVIVRDIVGKFVIAQFRAHKSPISALCFDRSGTLLVTASVHGNSINVFRIMPSPLGNSSGFDATTSHVHLYRLQRGFTNAVIQDISFSDDSRWIMISSSRGTSHLFAISPSGGTVNLQSCDSSFTNCHNGFNVTAKSGVWPPNIGPSKLNPLSLYVPGPPVTLSVVSRIRNGNNGWRGTVSGAAAAATGRTSPLSGAIASVFHNCKGAGVYSDASSLRTKHHLLVFSPSGCVIQYVLRLTSGSDLGSDEISGLSTIPHEMAQDNDAGLIVDAVQKWDICHKQNRRDGGENVDIYGEHGNGDSKLFSRETKKGTSIYPIVSDVDTKVKLNAEDKHHLYISEVELEMHTARNPLWAKSEIYFQVMMTDGIKTVEDTDFGGETEIERIPTRMVEARSKELIPAFNYLQLPRFHQPRATTLESNRNGLLVGQKSGLSEDEILSHRHSCSSLECSAEGNEGAELPSGAEENVWGGLHALTDSIEGPVNTDSPKMKTLLEFVNNSDHTEVESQLEFVNKSVSLDTETHFDPGINELD
ncbi:Autophagy-related protein 18g [Acorus calamus]|uniref:Autophagy-related protein 18g n=1 Tax=Acorus calamus TaxID=4465 RepID=A0AAV9FMB2_ACOCL|nr:Autophagy-related protein 18g [Acorus calamus]